MSISELYRAVGQIGQIPTTGDSQRISQGGNVPTGPSEFQKVLDSQLNYSQHAESRIKSRAIPWDAAMEKRILSGIQSAEAKGSREALILADNLAVIANVKSKTVITAMDRSQMKERIFTNIDSAVLV